MMILRIEYDAKHRNDAQEALERGRLLESAPYRAREDTWLLVVGLLSFPGVICAMLFTGFVIFQIGCAYGDVGMDNPIWRWVPCLIFGAMIAIVGSGYLAASIIKRIESSLESKLRKRAWLSPLGGDSKAAKDKGVLAAYKLSQGLEKMVYEPGIEYTLTPEQSFNRLGYLTSKGVSIWDPGTREPEVCIITILPGSDKKATLLVSMRDTVDNR